MASAHAKKKTAPVKNINFVLAGVVVFAAVVAVLFSSGVFNVKNTVADKTEFMLGDKFLININRDIALYNEPEGNDMLVIYMTAKNVTPDPGELEVENTTGYDDDTPTVDELTEEERNNLSYEESERINEKTFNEINKKLYKRKSVGNFISVYASQDGKALYEPSGIARGGGEDDQNNATSLHKTIESDSTYSFYLIYQLNNQEPMQLVFNPPMDSAEIPSEPIVINFDISKRISWTMHWILAAENAEVASKKAVNNVELKGLTINLVDGWYADEQMNANIRLKNDKFKDSQLSISYDSSGNAKSVAEMSRSWVSSSAPAVETIDINDQTYYYFSSSSSTFVLTTDGPNNLVFKITGQNISLDDARPLIENLSF